MRLSSTALGLMGLLILRLSLSAGSGNAEPRHSQPSKSGGCVFVVVTDSATDKPLAFANCAAVELMTGGLSDSLGHCLVCGLPAGTVVMTTRAIWHVQRRDTVLVQHGRADTLHVRLRRLRPQPGTAFGESVKH
jgi:hypothetical protein